MRWEEKSNQRKLQDIVRFGLIGIFAWGILKTLRKIITEGGTKIADDNTVPTPGNVKPGKSYDQDDE